MSTRKRKVQEEEEEEDDVNLGDENDDHDSDGHRAKQLKLSLEFMFNSKVEIRTKGNEGAKFAALPEERRKTCIKAVLRFFIFKGTKKEHVNRSMVGDILAQIDPECKKHINAVLSFVQPKLAQMTGYQIVPGDAIKGYSRGKREDFYVLNALMIPSPLISEENVANLRSIFQDGELPSSSAYQGFKFIVFHLIFSGSGQKTTLSEIIRQMNKLDSRFPVTITTQQYSTNTARNSLPSIPELGDNIVEMLQRMRREEYIEISKDEADAADIMKNIYEFGPRFYLEIGKRSLLISYFQLLGQPIDETDLKLLTETKDDAEEVAEGEEEGA